MSYKRDWSGTEKFFSRSWTHIFYFWKLRQVMLGKTTHSLLAEMSNERNVRVMDLGCGPGTNIFDVYDVCAEFDHVDWYGLDLNQREAALGADRSAYRVQERSMRPVRFMSGDIFHLPVQNNSLDIVLCSEVVEHLPNPLPAIQEMHRVLKPGGYALVTTPNPRNLPEMVGYALDWAMGGRFKKMYWKGQDEVSAPPLSAEVGFGHVSVHPFSIWRQWFADSGLPVIRKVRGPMIFGSPFFDRHRFFSGMMIAMDPLLDRLPGKFFTSVNLGLLCRKM